MIDKFFYSQPNKTFQKDLEKFYIPIIQNKRTNTYDDYVIANGVYIDVGDFINDKTIKSSADNFERFVKTNDIKGDRFKVLLKKKNGLKKECFELFIDENLCTVYAGDREGIRRALIYFQDELISNGSLIKKGKHSKNINMDLRLARCFFAPVNRPPRNIAELDDDLDYYPEAYLDRLMYDGANAVWVYADLDMLVKSTFITEFGQDSQKRINKLNRLIEKCSLYGIKVYLFTIAPMSLDEQTIQKRYPGIDKKYPQVAGNDLRGPKGFCVYSEFGKAFLSEAIENLIKSVPELGGVIDITLGERVTTCGNTWPDYEGKWSNTCPYCKDKSRMEIVTHTSKIIKDAIDKINADIDFISWTYGCRGQAKENIYEYADKCPGNVIMLQNYEDDGRVTQLGKKRFALDYYLSYVGPSQMFKYTAERAISSGKKIYAKMQVCCSHELATVPYVPVPGIIYDKIIGAKVLGVSGIMESWLFGNYPCIMSKAVGLLSYENDFKNKQDFLRKLARLYRNGDDAEKTVSAWNYFEKGYSNYPVNVMFNYYGPMHDGVVWELALKPKNKPLPRSWQLTDVPDGDRIGECLFKGHTLDEAIELCTVLCVNWQKGLDELRNTTQWGNTEDEQISVAKALGVLFKSGLNVLRFYKLRDNLGYRIGDANKTLTQMKEIVLDEIANSNEMIGLCENDNRLGYHSEAEGYKFFPEKLRNRVESLQNLLNQEFVEIESRIKKGLVPLTYYEGNGNGKSVVAGRNGLDSAEWGFLDDGKSKFRISIGENLEIEIESDGEKNFCFNNEFRLMFPEPTLVVKHDGTILPFIEAGHQSLLDENAKDELSKWSVQNLSCTGNTHLILRIKKEESGFIRLPYKFLIATYDGAKWCRDKEPCYTLGKCLLSPGDFGWIK